jgi:glycosyltransferase involved in cell wall biosynthesis
MPASPYAPDVLMPEPLAPGSVESGERVTEVLVAARWPVGGIRTHLGYNQPALAEAGHRCTFVVPDDASLPALRETVPGGDVVAVPAKGRDCPMWRTLRPLVTCGTYSLVHAHGLTAAAHASLACLGSGVPLLVTLHEPLRDAQFAGLVGPCKRWLLGQALARAAAIVVVSDDSRANLLRYFPNLRRRASTIHTIPNGIDTDRFADDAGPEMPPLREQLGLDDETTLVGFLGRFMPEKGFPLLLDAAERLVKFGGVPRFHLVAFGSGDYRREYARRVEESGLGRNVTLRDFVPDVRPVLDQLDLVVTPSLWEASSLISMEAMCAGVPVLGSDCPGLREVLRGTPSRTVKAGCVATLETGLRQALAEPWYAEADAYAAAARRRYHIGRSSRRLVELYASLSKQPISLAGR